MVYFIHHPSSFYRSTSLQQAYKCITRDYISSATTTHRQRHHHRLYATLPDDPQDPDNYNQDSGTQDKLIQMLRLEIGKKQVEEQIEEEVEQGSERLRQVAEEAKAEIDKLAELNQLRSDLAFDSTLADINREFDEFEKELQASQEEAKAKAAEVAKWKKEMTKSRSEGQFFRQLYEDDSDDEDEDEDSGKGRDVASSSGGQRRRKKKRFSSDDARLEAKARSDKVVEPARSETASKFRFLLFGALSGVLAVAVLADVTSAEPSPGQDALYAAIATALAFTAIQERKYL